MITSSDLPDECRMPTLSLKSAKSINYDVHPFDQCCEQPMSHYTYNDDLVQTEFIDTMFDDNNMVFKNIHEFPEVENFDSFGNCKWGDKILYIGEGSVDVMYLVAQGNVILSVLLDPDTDYQLGDGETTTHLWAKKLIVNNEGDVSSIVIIEDTSM